MLIKLGDKGPEVKRLQVLLGIKNDGVFGSDTRSKVRDYQYKHNLNVDGVFGNTSMINIVENKPIHINNLPSNLSTMIRNSEEIKSFNILHLTHFLSQCTIESNNFKKKEESLRYSPERLVEVFPYYFRKRYNPLEYSYNSNKLANLVYSNKGGNGSIESGDGYKYRGRGYIQLTLKDNYKKVGDYLRLDLINKPDLVFDYPLEVSVAYFKLYGSYRASSRGFDNKTISEVTGTINKAKLDLKRRIEAFDHYWLKLNNK